MLPEILAQRTKSTVSEEKQSTAVKHKVREAKVLGATGSKKYGLKQEAALRQRIFHA